MGDVITFKKPKASDKHRGKTLCKSGFHKWEVVKGNPFDVKQGKMVTRYRCVRCGATRIEAR
jgi:hypothetical protein